MENMIKNILIPFLTQKIQSLEANIANTRKGIKNKFARFFKAPERGESDGLLDNFRMN